MNLAEKAIFVLECAASPDGWEMNPETLSDIRALLTEWNIES